MTASQKAKEFSEQVFSDYGMPIKKGQENAPQV